MQFDSLDDIRAFCRDLPRGDVRAAENAALRQQVLTKPPGSLGLLEELAIWLARWQCREIPQLERGTPWWRRNALGGPRHRRGRCGTRAQASGYRGRA